MIVLLGELSVDRTKIDLAKIARQVCKEVGFVSEETGLDGENCEIIINVHAQDANIANAVHVSKDELDMGAGD